MKNLIQDIKTKLNIQGGAYIDAEIESYIEKIDSSEYLSFFKALSGEHGYLKPMDRIATVAKQFSSREINKLLAGTYEQAKEMYNKFNSESGSMEDYAQKNRNKVPNDREFFKNMPYEALKRTDGTSTYTKQELFVLNALGGGSWLMDIRCHSNSNEVINKIENIIKNAVETKYSKQNFLPTNTKVKSLIQTTKR